MNNSRYLGSIIPDDALASGKMALVSGPRQVGKTTLGKQLLKASENYFSWDQSSFRRVWNRFPENILEGLGDGPVLLDEIHKDRRWKSKLKGLYDHVGDEISIIVTGSAKLDLYRKGGDSLLGRYIPYRLHPFSVAENDCPPGPQGLLQKSAPCYPWRDLMALGGYPEPLLAGSEKKAQRWSRLRLDRLAFEDTRDIKVLSDLNAFRALLDLIPEKVGSLFSFHSLKEDVGVAYATVRDWVLLAEALYYGFFIPPYAKKVKRSIRAAPKFYLYDLLQIPRAQVSRRQENLVALHLLKACHFWTDTAEGLFELFFLRDKSGREVDFLITQDKAPWVLVECKSNRKELSPHLLYYREKLKTKLNFQLVDDDTYDRRHRIPKVRVLGYEKFFAGLV